MKATFEEKTYESYFNSELDRKSKIYYPIGQAQEGLLGFDSSAYSLSRSLWRRLGHPFYIFPDYGGAYFADIAEHMERFLSEEINHIPDKLKVNLLFQYKRPEYITRPYGKQWAAWGMDYFRYEIYGRQQILLKRIHDDMGDKVLVTYACPAMYDHNDLVHAKIRGEIIQRSNFTKAVDLDAHHWNTFSEAGIHSIGFSEPEQIKSFDLLGFLTGLAQSDNRSTDQNNRYFVINFSKQMAGIIREDKSYATAFDLLMVPFANLSEYNLLYSYITMINIKQLTGLQWLIA